MAKAQSEIAHKLIKAMSELPDPRVLGRTEHRLLDVGMLAIVAHLCGCDDWDEIAMFCRLREGLFREFLELPNGIPSHDTFRRVFMIIDATKLEACFANWIRSAVEVVSGQVIAIDGKELRRSASKGKGALRIVSAWATANGVVLGQRAVDDKSNEINAIPELLATIEVRGCIITADAMHCQTETTRLVLEHGANYVLALKGNQGKLNNRTRQLFADADDEHFANVQGHASYKVVNTDHGRTEERECTLIADPEYIAHVDQESRFVGLASIVRVRATRHMLGKKAKTETRFYISSLAVEPAVMNMHIRTHWQIEASLHWVLDVPLDEDRSRKRAGNSAETFTVLRHITVSLMKQDPQAKMGVKGRRKMAALSQDYLLQLLDIKF